jgi:hypothetical protein
MICRQCFAPLTKRKEYDVAKGMVYTYKICDDCRWEGLIKARPLLPKDQNKLMKLWYEGNTVKECLVYGD